MSLDELDAKHGEVLDILQLWLDGAVDPEEARDEIDELLDNLNLYPFAQCIELGVAAASLLEKKPESAVDITLQLVGGEAKGTRAMATVMISRLARFHPKIWMDLAKHLAADNDWEVREYAAHIFDSQGQFEGLADVHLDFCFEVLGEWVRDDNYLVRRAPTNALLGYYLKHPEIGERMIALLEPLLDDDTEYVQRNLVFALRTLGRKRPDLVFDFIQSKASALSERSRNIFQQVLDHRFADKVPLRKKELLSRISARNNT